MFIIILLLSYFNIQIIFILMSLLAKSIIYIICGSAFILFILIIDLDDDILPQRGLCFPLLDIEFRPFNPKGCVWFQLS